MAEPVQRIQVIGVQQLEPGEWTARVTTENTAQEVQIQIQSPSTAQEEENLRWYLEDHALADPLWSGKAKDASSNLADYGKSLLGQLRLDLQHARQNRPFRLEIEECEQSTGFHNIHWEILEDPEIWPREDGGEAPTVFVRRIVGGTLVDPTPLAPSDCIRILLVISRHLARSEAGHRMVSRKLFEIKKNCGHGRIHVEIVRPGTFEAFEAHLKERGPGYFHVVHFDVHGSVVQSSNCDISRAYLHFLSNNLGPNGLPRIRGFRAAQIGGLLLSYKIGMAVINACDSAKSGLSNDGNLAQTFVKAGVPTVLAMSFKALASAVEKFFEVFYSELLLKGCSFEAAAYSARRHLARNKMRSARFGIQVSVDDWISPVVYQLKGHNNALYFGLTDIPLHIGSVAHHNSFESLVGRDLDIFQLEMLLHQSNVLELYGDSGVGKTALLQHLSGWWKESDYVEKVLAFDSKELFSSLREICREACRLIDARDSQETGLGSSERESEEFIEQTIVVLREHRYLIILDDLNLEIASKNQVNGIRRFLSHLEGGLSLVIFTSVIPQTRAIRYRLGGLTRYAAIELVMTTVRPKGESYQLADTEMSYMDWSLELMRRLPAGIEIISSVLQNFSYSPRLLFETLLKGFSALHGNVYKVNLSQVYHNTSTVYHDLPPRLRNVVLLFSPFWGYIPVDTLDGYVYLVWKGWPYLFPRQTDSPYLRRDSNINGHTTSAANASGKTDDECQSLSQAVDLVRARLIESGLWTLEVSKDGAQAYSIHPLFTLCIRRIAEEQGDDFAYRNLLRIFAMWHRCRDLCLWEKECLDTIESTGVSTITDGSKEAVQHVGVFQQLQWTERWLREKINVLTSFYVGLDVESDEDFLAIFPAERFFHVGDGVSKVFYTDHMMKNPGLKSSKPEVPPPFPSLIMELAEQAVERVRRILEGGKPLDEAFFINSLFNALWTAAFCFQYSNPESTHNALNTFILLFKGAQNVPVRSCFETVLGNLKRDYTILLGAFYWSTTGDHTPEKAGCYPMNEDFLLDLRELCETKVEEAPWLQREYCRSLYGLFRESDQYSSTITGYESQYGSIDIEKHTVADFMLKADGVFQVIDDRFGHNQSRSNLLQSLDKAMESGNVQLQLSIHSQLCTNTFHLRQWNDAAFHTDKVLELDKEIDALSNRLKLNMLYNRAYIANELGDLDHAKETLLELRSRVLSEDWVAQFDALALLAQVQFKGGWDRWATIESCISALRIACSHSEQFRLVNYKRGQLFAFMFQSLWSETSRGSEITDSDISLLSEILGSSDQDLEAELSKVNLEIGASSSEGGVGTLIFARAEHAIFSSLGLERG